jgi:hypothetical protein
MPKVVNYAARFEFVRRAAFLVVRDQGPHALSRRSVANALGTSVNSVRRLVSEDADLRQLAADEVAQRRTRGRWDQRRDLTGVDRATFLLGRVLPDEQRRVAEELVWLRLVVDSCAPTPGDDTVATLQAEHLVADRGYVPESHRPPETGTAPEDGLIDLWREHDALVDRAVAGALAAVGADSLAERSRTRAVVDGLLLSTCLGRTSPEEAVATLEHHVAALAPAARVTA